MDPEQYAKRTYLGDSVYATNDGYHTVLFLDNGMGVVDIQELYLESSVMKALIAYDIQWRKAAPEEKKEETSQ